MPGANLDPYSRLHWVIRLFGCKLCGTLRSLSLVCIAFANQAGVLECYISMYHVEKYSVHTAACPVQVRWTHPTTGAVYAFSAAVVYVFQKNRELDVAVLQALPTAGAFLLSLSWGGCMCTLAPKNELCYLFVRKNDN